VIEIACFRLCSHYDSYGSAAVWVEVLSSHRLLQIPPPYRRSNFPWFAHRLLSSCPKYALPAGVRVFVDIGYGVVLLVLNRACFPSHWW
jgi:hypothetical protein